jgi:MFS family permease
MSPVSMVTGLEGLRALRHRNFRLFWSGQLISLVGTWMQQVAQGWLVLTLTSDPFMLGVVVAAQFVPVMIFGLFGGIVADSLPKRGTLIATQTVAMTLAFILAVLTATGTVQVWEIVLLAFALGCTNAIDMPTRQSFVIEMVGREDIGNAVALNSAIFNAARIVGPAVAGLTIGVFDISTAFFINGLSFVAVIGCLVAMRPEELTAAARTAMPRTVGAVFATLAEGLGYVRRTHVVLLGVSVVGLVSLVGMNFSVVVPAMARDVLGTGAEGYGFLMAASGLGSLAAALAVAFLGRPSQRVLVGGAIVLGVLEVVMALSHSMALSLACMFGIGAGGIAMAMTANTAIQLTVPDVLRGRVMAVYTTVFAGSTPLGGLAFGAIAAISGVSAAILVGGLAALAIGIVAAIVAWRWGLLRRSPSDRVTTEWDEPQDRRLMGDVGVIDRATRADQREPQADGVVVGVVRVVDP